MTAADAPGEPATTARSRTLGGDHDAGDLGGELLPEGVHESGRPDADGEWLIAVGGDQFRSPAGDPLRDLPRQILPRHEFRGFGFATYFRDSPSQDYANQRYYNPWFGRFNTPDPSGSNAVDPLNPITWNRYAYANGDPVNFHDPTGLDACSDGGGESWSDVNGGWDCVFDTDQEKTRATSGVIQRKPARAMKAAAIGLTSRRPQPIRREILFSR